jgi:histidinol phosphatase-like enzyme (inositol monophosphatase family)
MTPQLAELLTFANELADLAAPIARRHFRSAHDVESKPDQTPVTIADRAIETALRDRIEQRYPEHGIYGEEHGTARLDAEFVWVVDPIDGTKAFASGNPLFGTLIGLMQRGTPIAGVVDAPALGERYHGALGAGSFRNGTERLRTRDVARVDDAVLYCTTPDLLLDHPGHRALRARSRWTSFGGDCMAYAWLSAGTADVVVDTTLKPFDWCALVPIVREAGGELHDWHGAPLTLDSSGDAIAAATPSLAASVREVLAG